MRSYGRFPMHVWDGKGSDAIARIRDRHARRLARYLLEYLFSAPDSHSIGLYEISPRTIARHTELDDTELPLALEALDQAAIAYYDEEREVVYVPLMAEVEHPDGLKPKDKQHVGIINYLKKPNLRRSKYFGAFMKAHGARLRLTNSSAADADGEEEGEDAGEAEGEGEVKPPRSQPPCEGPPEAQRTEGRGQGTEGRSASREAIFGRLLDFAEVIAPIEWDATIARSLPPGKREEFHRAIAAAELRVQRLSPERRRGAAEEEHRVLNERWGGVVGVGGPGPAARDAA